MEYLKQLSSPKWTDSKNQLRINGFDFIEFTTKFPLETIDIFTSFGFVLTSRHHSKNIFLLEQGEVKFIVNAEVGTDAASFESIHGSGVCGMGFRVEDSNFALQAALEKGAEAVICSDYGLPAIRGIGGSKIYLIDRQTSEHFLASFFQTKVEIAPANPQITCVDHITHNVFRGNMEAWAKFYERIFNFQEIRYFNIKGKKTGLRSKALISPCGKIRIPLNESQDDHSQIAEFLKKYNGEGIQHIALGCDDICSVVNQIKQQGVVFQDTPDTYYDLIAKRIPNHEENATALKKLRILIDGNKQEDGILLQIFTKETIGPIFFEFIERKGNEGFGEGNFQALFESIELDQIRRGVLSVAESFKPLSSEELENYVNPSLAKVAFGGEETGIRTIELGREHSLFKFLEQFSQTERSAVTLSLFSILLHKYTGQEQFKLRQYQIAEESYQLDLASNLTEKSCFNELLTSAQKLNDDKFNHQHNLVDDTQNNDVNYSLAYFAPGISQEKIDTLTQNHLAQSEMCLLLDSDSHAYLAYNQALFDDNFLTNLIRHFDILIQNIQSDYQGNLEFLSLTSQTDLTLQCDRGQTPNSDYGHLPIYRHFEQYAQKFPESIAITFGQQQVSYSALNCQANQLAHYLINQNIQPQDCVGVFVEPGVEILIAILAIHKINGVYVPIDTEYPLGRIKTVIEQVSPGVIIGASERLNEIEQNFEIETINLAALNLTTFAQSNLNYSCPAESISHIFFTSGTTGTPKGVVFSHRNLIHYIFAAQEKYHFSAADSFLSATRYTFSISLLMLLLPLVRGGQVNIITLEQLLVPQLLAKAIEKSSFFHLGPSILKMLLDFLEQDNYNSDRFSQVKHASLGGDMIPADILNRLNRVFTQAEVYAIYGSSEISCMGCTYFVPKEQEIKQTLVGKPFNNVGLRVLDQHQRVIPVGVKGEIYFSGAGISQGYLNLPHRTKTSYVWLDGERFCRTGDIGRLTPQGNLQILGRDDNQVQIRGMRIELGEIESSLNLHPAIGACVVIVKQDRLGEKQIIAYLISQNESPTSKQLRSFLQATLPQYMIPAYFVSVAEFPLNPNGKVDRRALSEMDNISSKQSETDFAPPSNPTEELLATIWADALGLEQVSIHDNFFELGGSSIQAVNLFTQIDKQFGKSLPLATLFQSATVAEIAQIISQKKWLAPWESLVPLKPTGTKPPLFYIHGGGGNLLVYRDLVYSLGSDQPVYGLQPRGLDGKYSPYIRIEDMADYYLAQIRKIQPNGPYLLAGLSSGGIIAWEIAQRIKAQGQKVDLLAMFDTNGPDYFKLLPPLSRLLSVVNWVLLDFLNQLSSLPYKFVLEFKKMGAKEVSIKIFEKFGLVNKTVDENKKINQEKMQRNFKNRIEQYKRNSYKISRLEKLANSLSIFLLKHSSSPFYTNVFAKGMYFSTTNYINNLPDDLPDNPDNISELLQQVQEANIKAHQDYVPQVYHDPVILFQASERPPGFYEDPKLGWGDLPAGGMEIYEIPGDHTSIMKSPILAEKLRICLEKAQADTSI